MKFSNLLAVAGLLHSAVSDSGSSECPEIPTSRANFHRLPDILPVVSPFPDQIATETIRNTMALYAFALDSRNWKALSRVFAPDARGEFSDPFGTYNGVENITNFISEVMPAFYGTHHRYGTQYIAICSPTSAVSVTYVHASHFLTPTVGPDSVDDSQVIYITGRYLDKWSKLSDGSWKIINKNFILQGPVVGPHGFREFRMQPESMTFGSME